MRRLVRRRRRWRRPSLRRSRQVRCSSNRRIYRIARIASLLVRISPNMPCLFPSSISPSSSSRRLSLHRLVLLTRSILRASAVVAYRVFSCGLCARLICPRRRQVITSTTFLCRVSRSRSMVSTTSSPDRTHRRFGILSSARRRVSSARRPLRGAVDHRRMLRHQLPDTMYGCRSHRVRRFSVMTPCSPMVSALRTA